MEPIALCIYLFLLASIVQGGSVLQFTDFHIDSEYSVSEGDRNNWCHKREDGDVKSRVIGAYGDYNCDSPTALVKHLLQTASDILPKPDFILWTGDSFPHFQNYSADDVNNVIQQVTQYINSSFPGRRVFPVFGNHDYWPSDQLPDQTNAIYDAVFKQWKDWIGEEAAGTFRSGGFYRADVDNETVILGLNTALYYKQNTHQMNNPTDPAGQFAFMRNEFETARNANKVVHIIAHIPPGAFEQVPNVTWLRDYYNTELLEILRDNYDVIRWLIFGHSHRDSFRVIQGRNGSALMSIFIAPAVAPARFNVQGYSANNPSFRVYDYTDDWKITDIRQFYINLLQLNKNPNTSAQLEYSFKKAYEINATVITAKEIGDTIQKIKTNDRFYEKYITYNAVSSPSYNATGYYRTAQLCALEYVDYTDYSICLLMEDEITRPQQTSFTTHSTPLIPLILLFFLGLSFS